jgi:regulator of protease activity HflC (stomatin/prohibitin superfamily)
VLDVSFQPGRPYISVRDRDGVILALSGIVRRHARTLEQRMREEAQARAQEQRMREEAQARAQRLQDEVRAQEQRLQDEARARARLEERLAEEAQARAALEEMVRRLSAQHEGPETAS